MLDIWTYSKTCVKWPLKIDKTKVLMTTGSLMKVKSIAECSLWSILQYFWPALVTDNRSWKTTVLHRFYCSKLSLINKTRSWFLVKKHRYGLLWLAQVYVCDALQLTRSDRKALTTKSLKNFSYEEAHKAIGKFLSSWIS